MMQRFLSADYLFWAVVFAFYVLDNLKLVAKNQLMLRQKLFGGYVPLISFSEYEIQGKEVKLPHLLLPFTLVFILSWTPSRQAASPKEMRRTDRRLKVFRARMLSLQIIGTLSFLLLLSGPVLTFYFGLSLALILLLPLHLICLIAMSCVVLARSRRLNLPLGKAALLIFECTLVPAYLSNIVRRISWRQTFSADGFTFALKHTAASNLEQIEYQIARKLDQFAADEANEPLYRDYKSALGIK